MKQLQMTFKNSEGKKINLTLSNLKQDLDAVTVKGAMQTIVDSKLFVKEDVSLYAELVGANYVERTVTSLFTATGK